jgi:hypothetical protein
VNLVGQVQDELELLVKELSLLSPLGFELIELSVGWHSSGHQKPEHGFWERLMTTLGLLCLLLELGDGKPVESDTLHVVESTSIIEHNREASHAEHGIVDLYLSDDFVSMLLSELEKFWKLYENYDLSSGGSVLI